MKDRLPLTAAILAGGRSMRMGVDKTLLPFDGEALLARVVSAVSPICSNTMIVTNRPEGISGLNLSPDIRILSDEVPYQGPLGGLVTALSLADDEWVLALAADMPFISPGVVQALWDATSGVDVVVPVTHKGLEPLLALYSRRCLPVARNVLASGRRRLVAIFKDLRVAEVSVESLRGVDPELKSFVNLNTPEELEAARKTWVSISSRPPQGAEGSCKAVRHLERESAPSKKAIKVIDGRGKPMPMERPITLYLNEREIATIQASPVSLDEMAVGFFVAEGLITDPEAVKSIDVDHKRGFVFLNSTEPAPGEEVYRSRFVTSGCGKGVTFSSLEHARGIAAVESSLCVEAGLLYRLMGETAQAATTYKETGGMHACALASGGKILALREDVGRHNAVDKVLGRAWLDRLDAGGLVMITTGRISYEMAVKAARAGLPIAVSRTAVTDQAVEVARALGVTVAGYVRARKMVVYSHPHRILKTSIQE